MLHHLLKQKIRSVTQSMTSQTCMIHKRVWFHSFLSHLICRILSFLQQRSHNSTVTIFQLNSGLKKVFAMNTFNLPKENSIPVYGNWVNDLDSFDGDCDADCDIGCDTDCDTDCFTNCDTDCDTDCDIDCDTVYLERCDSDTDSWARYPTSELLLQRSRQWIPPTVGKTDW